MVRCFIGIMLPSDLRDKFSGVQERLKELPMDCKMVEPENLHICLSFLGNVEEDKLQSIKGKLDGICKRYGNGEAEISGIRLIPNEKHFRVIAFDCKSDVLESLRKGILKDICDDSYPPHVTLCRVRNTTDKEAVVDGIKKIGVNIGKFAVSSVQIIKSELSRDGPKYSILHECALS